MRGGKRTSLLRDCPCRGTTWSPAVVFAPTALWPNSQRHMSDEGVPTPPPPLASEAAVGAAAAAVPPPAAVPPISVRVVPGTGELLHPSREIVLTGHGA